IGDTVRVKKGLVHAEITVEAAPWVSLNQVTLYLDGKEWKRWAVPPSTSVVRFRGKADVKVTHDSYLVVRAEGPDVLATVIGDRSRFDVRPLALTNPIFLDTSGNGVFDAPLGHGAH